MPSPGSRPRTRHVATASAGPKGALAVGLDADIALVDLSRSWTVRAADSVSAQEYSPLEGFEMTAAVTDVFLRGSQIVTDGVVTDVAGGRYLSRPTG